ncbi:hypothetical protein [Flavobacterium chilense]|uniref:hypothetical protein n=1 Tax=Flavobacterium chilense TaxID=946677 RepID=UPI00083AA7F5|nr:hypothetical protein [Flavobacterium chilense]
MNRSAAAVCPVEIFYTEPNTPEDDELGLLIVLIKDFEDKHYPILKLNALHVMKAKALKI